MNYLIGYLQNIASAESCAALSDGNYRLDFTGQASRLATAAEILSAWKAAMQDKADSLSASKADRVVISHRQFASICDILQLLYKMAGGNATALATLTAAERTRLQTYNGYITRVFGIESARKTKHGEITAVADLTAAASYDVTTGWPE